MRTYMIAAGAALAVSGVAFGSGVTNDTVDIDISGFGSWDAQGDATNETILIDVASALGLASGSEVNLTAIGWDVNQTGIDPSWLNEMVIGFLVTGDVVPSVNLTPSGTGAPGTESNSSGGLVDLSDALGSNLVLPDGMLTLEFFEGFDDNDDVLDGTWDANSVITLGTLEVPAPTTAAVLGLAGVAGIRRRRA